jgi:hypothetical protein
MYASLTHAHVHVRRRQVTYHATRLPLDSIPPERCSPKLMRLINSCWESEPARRPAAAEAAKILTLILQVGYGRVRHTMCVCTTT